MTDRCVLLGFEVGTGARIEVPLAHTFVTGQTQLSGKTTTLRALVDRFSRRRSGSAQRLVLMTGDCCEGG